MTDAAPARLHVLEVGEEGPRVAFLHGLFGQGRNFHQIAKALLPDFRSALVDLPDHGRSPWTAAVSYAGMADAVADLFRERYADDLPLHLVGHSMGGKVAMLLALRHPALVDRLVVVDIAPADSDGSAEFAHLLDSLAALDLRDLARRSDADEQLRPAIPDDRVRGFLLQNLAAGTGGFRWLANLDVLRRDLEVIGGFPTVGETFDHPVLWIGGERSSYVLPEHAAPMRRLFPRTTTVTIKGAGHWVHSEQPAAFVSALRVFLGEPRGSTG